jgi:MFS family permease
MATYMRMLSFGVPFKAFTRDIWLICISNVVGAFGEGLYFWVFPLYIRQLQADYVQLGLVFSALYGVSALAPLPGGMLSDRFDRKKVLILGWTPWVFAPLLYSLAQNWTQLIPGTICWGVSMLGAPALNAYVITAVNDQRNLASVLSFVWSSYSFSYIFAPTVGAFIATVIGMQWLLRLSGLLCAVAAGIFLFLHSQHPVKNEAKTQMKSVHNPDEKRLWRLMLIWAGFYTAITFFMTVGRTFVPIFLSEQVKLSEFHVGLFGSINFAGTTFIGIAVGRMGDKWRKPRAMSICLMLYFVSMIPLLLIKEPAMLMTTAFLYGGAIVTGSIVSAYVGTIAPENKRGLWISIPQTLSLVAAFAAPYLGGYLYSQSPIYAFLVSIVPMPFLVLSALAWLKEEPKR